MQYLAFLGNIGMQEMIVIFVIALLIFGPKNLPKLGKALGQTVREFREASNKMAESITNLDDDEETPRRPSRQPASIPSQSTQREAQPAAATAVPAEKK